MIGASLHELVFIKACIFFLQYTALISLLTCLLTAIIWPNVFQIPLSLAVLAVVESAFYLVVYLPRRYVLQRPTTHPSNVSREERQKLFDLCHGNVADVEKYLSKWFMNAPLSEIKRENVKEFFCWGFLNKGDWDKEDDEELEKYADKVEQLLGRKLAPGLGSAKPTKLTLDRVNMKHRSLIWYLCVWFVDNIAYISMLSHGFRFHRLPLSRFFTIFPLRPCGLFTTHRSPAKTISYWYRPHTSKNRLPVLFVHGIGIGLYPYVKFLADINAMPRDEPPDDQIGIIAVEIMPISFRITTTIPPKDQLCNEIAQILDQHRWQECVLVSHSYGSVISTHLLQHEQTARRIGPVVLVDPVSILLHLPDVAYNFTCRRPRRANEHQLYYFASMDMGVSHTLARSFFWSENILWKEDVRDRPTTVALSGRDLIVDTPAVARYLTSGPAAEGSAEREQWRKRKWKGQGLDVLWFEEQDHAQIFDQRMDYFRVIEAIRCYCWMKD